RAPAQPGARRLDRRSHQAARRERRAPVRVVEQAPVGRDPGPGVEAARPAVPGSVPVRVHQPGQVKSERQANRRIRLLLAVFVLLFACTLARATWLQGVQAASLGRMAQRQHRESITVPAGRGTIFDRTGLQLAIGEQTTTVYADPRQVTEPRRIAVAAHTLLGANANALYPQLLDKRRRFSYMPRFANPKIAPSFIPTSFP